MELLRRYANRPDLLDDLSRAVARLQATESAHPDEKSPDELSSACRYPRQRLLSSRFTYDDVASMIAKYQAGATVKRVATEYEIGMTSLKQLIRERKARRKDRQSDLT